MMSIQIPSIVDQYPQLSNRQNQVVNRFDLPNIFDEQGIDRKERFPKTPKIPGLDLSFSDLSKSQLLNQLNHQLGMNHSHEALFLSHNDLGEDLTQLLCQKMAQHPSNANIKHLILTDTGISNFAMAALADMLKVNHHIGWLVLNRNMIGDLGIDYLSKALEQNFGTVHLILSDNEITDRGVRSIVDSLTQHAEKRRLKSIFLQGNPICSDSVNDLIRLIQTLPSLERLDLRDTQILASSFKRLMDVAAEHGVRVYLDS